MKKRLLLGMLVLTLFSAFIIASCDSTDDYKNYPVGSIDGEVVFINNSKAEIEVTITSPVYESYRLRKAKGLSQSELGELVGVSNKAVSKWETYEANPDITLLPLLALSLGVTTDVLLSDIKAEKDDIKPTENGAAEEITLTLYKTLSMNSEQTMNKWLEEMNSLSAKEKLNGLLEKNLKAENLHSFDNLILQNINPHIIAARMIDSINKIAPLFAKLVKEGIKDGSIKTEYPDECAEVFLLLSNTWCDPFVFECDINTLKRRYKFIDHMMKKLGVDFLNE